MDFIVKGVVVDMLPVQSGVSQRTGQQWMRQTVKLEHESGQYPKSIVFDVSGSHIEECNLGRGEVVTVHLNINAREYNGRWFNSIECWKVERDGQQQGTQQPAQAQRPPYNPQQAQPRQQAQQQQASAQAPGAPADNLPF